MKYAPLAGNYPYPLAPPGLSDIVHALVCIFNVMFGFCSGTQSMASARTADYDIPMPVLSTPSTPELGASKKSSAQYSTPENVNLNTNKKYCHYNSSDARSVASNEQDGFLLPTPTPSPTPSPTLSQSSSSGFIRRHQDRPGTSSDDDSQRLSVNHPVPPASSASNPHRVTAVNPCHS